MWGRGKPAANVAPTGTAGAGSSNIPKTASKLESVPAKEATTTKMGPPSFMPTKKAAPAPTKSTAAVASGSKTSSGNKLVKPQNAGATVASTSSRSRSPMPSFSPTGTAAASTRTSRMSSIASLSNAATSKSRTSTNNVSSIGTRLTNKMTSPPGSMGVKNTLASARSSVASRTSSAHASANGTGSSSSRLSRMSTSSRLFAPTASSLAKMNRTSVVGASSTLKGVAEDGAQETVKHQQALGSITNSPVVSLASAVSPATTAMSPGNPARPPIFSPLRHGGGIFSKPLVLPHQSGIPTPVKKKVGETVPPPSGASSGTTSDVATGASSATTTAAPTRVKSLNGRKPRISRSKVIARLASQRAAGTSSGTSANTAGSSSGSRPAMGPRSSSSSSGKTRSSLGAKVSRPRASYGGGGNLIKGRVSSGGSTASGSSVMMSAKRKARQSEYARRRSSRVRGGLMGSSPIKGGEAEI